VVLDSHRRLTLGIGVFKTLLWVQVYRFVMLTTMSK
jgi:hypothetical protein